MCDSRGNATNEVEREKLGVPHGVFQALAKRPKEEHVADDVHPSAMQKHGGKQGYGSQVGRNNTVQVDEIVPRITVEG